MANSHLVIANNYLMERSYTVAVFNISNFTKRVVLLRLLYCPRNTILLPSVLFEFNLSINLVQIYGRQDILFSTFNLLKSLQPHMTDHEINRRYLIIFINFDLSKILITTHDSTLSVSFANSVLNSLQMNYCNFLHNSNTNSVNLARLTSKRLNVA